MNNDLDINSLAKEFQQNKKVIIKNFLNEAAADSLYSFLNSDMAEDWWHTAVLVGDKDSQYGSKPNYIRRFKDNVSAAHEGTFAAMGSCVNGFFSYSFDRTMDHVSGCECKLCNFIKTLNGEGILNKIKTITNHDLTRTQEFFASRYRQLQFLSPHHDLNKGKIGFVYNLSKNWRPEWGGNLHFLEDDYKTITKVIIPSFNTLVLFDIPTQSGVPHFVSQVAARVPNKRISITGWFN